MRILLICDHKWRDLPNLVALKVILETRYGHTVALTSARDRAVLLDLFQPDCLIFNHMNGKGYREIARHLQDQGVAVVVLPTEGRPSFKELLPLIYGQYTDLSHVDLYLSWSEHVTENMIRLGTISTDRVVTVGCTRFDFYCPPLNEQVRPKETFCRRYHLDPQRPIVTWATQYNYARFLHHKQDFNRRDLANMGVKARYEAVGYDIERFPEDQHYERRAASAAFFQVAQSRPHVQFIIKSHPGEDIAFYQKQVKEAGLSNVSFIFQEYIWDLLSATDLHLHRHCTTAIEAWLLGKPTVEMKMDVRTPFAWEEMEAGSDSAQSAAELGDIVDHYLAGHTITEAMQRRREAYVKEWFYKVDGQRCQEAAFYIDDLLKGRPGRRVRSSKARLRYTLSDRLNLPWRGISLRKPWTWRPERPSQEVQLDHIGSADRYITRLDVRRYEAQIKPLLLNGRASKR